MKKVLAEILRERTETIDIHYDGEPLIIGCSGNLMVEALNKMQSEDISVEFSVPSRPIIMREQRTETQLPENLMLVMPMMTLN